LIARVNDELPADINLLSAEKVSHRFHARRDAVARAYLYQVARRRMAFAKPYVWWVREPLDVSRLRDAAARFEGFHDFRSFSAEDDEEKSTAVALERVEVAEAGDLLLVRVEGSHFIWKMVRRMVGVVVGVGKGELEASDVDRFLTSPSGVPARLTAPGSGLFLERVFYPGDDRHHELRRPFSRDWRAAACAETEARGATAAPASSPGRRLAAKGPTPRESRRGRGPRCRHSLCRSGGTRPTMVRGRNCASRTSCPRPRRPAR
jgi:tRNA pseudouridine(38-40) synthase